MTKKCIIVWNTLPLDEWQNRFNKIKKSNILQSYSYAKAASRFYRQKVRWGLIIIDGKEAGLVQVMEASLFFNLIHGVIVDRGPLWFDGFGGAFHVQAFITTFQKEFPKRFGRKYRLLLEIEDSPSASALIKQTGLEILPEKEPYETYWLDLVPEIDALRSNLNGKWRNCLKKAENIQKEDVLSIDWDKGGLFYPLLREKYAVDKKERAFGGISPQFLDIFAPFLLEEGNMLIGVASFNDEPIASIMIVKHGQSATYQIGWTSDKGRSNNAHHLLLWQALNVLKQWGVTTLDLGGINNETAAGIKKFKQGVGGMPYRLVGHYR